MRYFRSQREFVERVRARNLPILHVSADSGAENFHGLHSDSQRMAIDCAKNMDDDGLIAKYQNKTAAPSGGVSASQSP
jgi:hypothetical protein